MVSTSADVLETHDIGEYSRVRSTGRGGRRGYLFLYEAGLISQLHGKRKPQSGPVSEERIQESDPRSNCVEFRAMHERIRFIDHHGKRILLVDFLKLPGRRSRRDCSRSSRLCDREPAWFSPGAYRFHGSSF